MIINLNTPAKKQPPHSTHLTPIMCIAVSTRSGTHTSTQSCWDNGGGPRGGPWPPPLPPPPTGAVIPVATDSTRHSDQRGGKIGQTSILPPLSFKTYFQLLPCQCGSVVDPCRHNSIMIITTLMVMAAMVILIQRRVKDRDLISMNFVRPMISMNIDIVRPADWETAYLPSAVCALHHVSFLSCHAYQ